MSCNCQKSHYCDCCCKHCYPGGLSPLTSCSGYGYDEPCSCEGPCDCNPSAVSDEYDYNCNLESIDDDYDHCCRPRRRRRPSHANQSCSCVNTLNYGCCTNATTWGRCR